MNFGINGQSICLNSFNNNILFAESKTNHEMLSNSDLVSYHNNSDLGTTSSNVPSEDISYVSPTSKRNRLGTSLDDGTYARIYKEYNITESLNKLAMEDAPPKQEIFSGTSKVIIEMIKNLTIVIADDAVVDRKFLTKIVNRHKGPKIDICTAQNGHECTELCEKILGDKSCNVENNLLIFMDINMPNKNGFEATREIRNFSKGFNPYIVGMSSQDTPEYRSSSLESGMNTFISKPFTVKKVQSLFNEINFHENNRVCDIFSPEFNDSKCFQDLNVY